MDDVLWRSGVEEDAIALLGKLPLGDTSLSVDGLPALVGEGLGWGKPDSVDWGVLWGKPGSCEDAGETGEGATLGEAPVLWGNPGDGVDGTLFCSGSIVLVG